MNEELDSVLCARYPAIFQAYDTNACRVFGFECGDGWFNLIDAGCCIAQERIIATGTEQLVASELKEKFGGLRFYYHGGDEYEASVVDLIESLSQHVCEICADPGRIISLGGWMQTRCAEHEQTSVPSDLALIDIRERVLMSQSLSAVLQEALEKFGVDVQSATQWLTSPASELGNAVPLQLAGSHEGQLRVLLVLGEIGRDMPT